MYSIVTQLYIFYFSRSFPLWLIREYWICSMCHIVGSWCLSILYIILCFANPKCPILTPPLFPPLPSPPWQPRVCSFCPCCWGTLVPWPGIDPRPWQAVRAASPNYRPARELPQACPLVLWVCFRFIDMFGSYSFNFLRTLHTFWKP